MADPPARGNPPPRISAAGAAAASTCASGCFSRCSKVAGAQTEPRTTRQKPTAA